MPKEKHLETNILDRYFKQIALSDEIPAEIVQRLLELRKEGALSNSELVLKVIQDGSNAKS
jgi:hypothetical protein